MQLEINRVDDRTDSHGFRFSVEKSHSVQNKGLCLATVAFCSSPITSLYVESNVLPLDFHMELLAVKALLHPYFLPSSPLRFLLASEDLASSS